MLPSPTSHITTPTSPTHHHITTSPRTSHHHITTHITSPHITCLLGRRFVRHHHAQLTTSHHSPPRITGRPVSRFQSPCSASAGGFRGLASAAGLCAADSPDCGRNPTVIAMDFIDWAAFFRD